MKEIFEERKKVIERFSRAKLLKATEVGFMLGVDSRTVLRWAEEGKLARVVLPNNAIRFKMEDIEEFVEKRREK